MSENPTETTADRRQVLKFLGGLAAVFGSAPACSPPAGDPMPTRVAIASIPVGGRLRVLHGEDPVELRRTERGDILGRSLWCTHFGYEVRWHSEGRRYLCPCHDGVYDADGNPVAGPPPRPLSEVAVTVEGEEAVIGAAEAAL